jgi:hypothetical protein
LRVHADNRFQYLCGHDRTPHLNTESIDRKEFQIGKGHSNYDFDKHTNLEIRESQRLNAVAGRDTLYDIQNPIYRCERSNEHFRAHFRHTADVSSRIYRIGDPNGFHKSPFRFPKRFYTSVRPLSFPSASVINSGPSL